MSVVARNWATHCRTGSRRAKSLLGILADAAKEKPVEGGQGTAHQCCLYQSTLAERAECSIPTLQRALNDLDAAGLVLTRFGATKAGYRTASTFYLNVNLEPVDAFASRCGIRRRPKHQNDGKEEDSLSIICEAPKHQDDVASTSNRVLNRERPLPKSRLPATELPASWSLPDAWRSQLLAEFDASGEQIDRLAKRFHNHYRDLAKPRDRRQANWFARLRQWCLDDFHPKGLAAKEELSDAHWAQLVKGWVDGCPWHPQLGPAPDKSGCRAPQRILREFGLGRSQEAA